MLCGAYAPEASRGTATAQSAETMSPDAARAAIIAAEDRRVALPDDVHSPEIETLRRLITEDVRLLVNLARVSRDSVTRDRAVRALGRYERRELTPELLQLLWLEQDDERMMAFAQSLRGQPLALDLSEEQIESVLRPTRFAFDFEKGDLSAIAGTLARLPYTKATQLEAVDAFLARSIETVERNSSRLGELIGITRAAESRLRRNSRLAGASEDLTTWLRRIVVSTRRSYPGAARANAMAALVASRGLDVESLRAAASATAPRDPVELRRLAALTLAGSGSLLALAERTDTIIRLMQDREVIVRIEAVRAWARQETATNGCMRLLDALSDPSVPVVLTIIDALGDACKTDANVTDRLAVEARVVPVEGWHRASHALVSLAKRAPDKVSIPMTAHVAHPTWQVRMYAARAAAITKDVTTLERLAVDSIDNVREAALPGLRALKAAESDPQFVAALGRPDYQLLRTAANELKGAQPTPELVVALVEALKRVTADQRDTSRDTRLALLERLRELGDENHSGSLVPLLQDFDFKVGASVAATIQKWTGAAQEILPRVLPRRLEPAVGDITVRVELHSGKVMRIHLETELTPLTSGRFLNLALAGYYNGLTFHRVVPNFVIQGGSPGANEYVGDGPYMRDELSLRTHSRGTVGISTRGRDTGDAQFFINLVDNPRLDFDYTVFGSVDSRDIEVLDTVLEGDRIDSITMQKPDEKEVHQNVSKEYPNLRKRS